MLGSVYGYTRCPNCGLSVPTAHLQGGSHECNEDNVIGHLTIRFRKDFDKERDKWDSDERLAKFRRFYDWLDKRPAPTSGNP